MFREYFRTAIRLTEKLHYKFFRGEHFQNKEGFAEKLGLKEGEESSPINAMEGTEMMDKRLSLVLNSDPGMGIVRHLDAGYDLAIEKAKETNIKFPSHS